MPDMASDVVHQNHRNWELPLNRQPQFPIPWSLPFSNVIRAVPPQLSDQNPGHGDGSGGLQEPANDHQHHENLFAVLATLFAVREQALHRDSDEESVDVEDVVTEHQLSAYDAEWHHIFVRLRGHEDHTPYPPHLLDNHRQALQNRHQELSLPSGTHSPCSTVVNLPLSTPSSLTPPFTLTSSTSTTTTRSHSPRDFLFGLGSHLPFVNRPPTPRFLWLSPVRWNEIPRIPDRSILDAEGH